MKVKDLPVQERPRERLQKVGVENLSNEELLSIILKSGNRKKSVKELSSDIIAKVGSIDKLKEVTKESLQEIDGIGLAHALTILSSVELGKRIFMDNQNTNRIILNRAEAIYDYMKYDLWDKKQEYFYCLYVNQKKELIERKLLFMGTLNRSIVHPREVFKHAYLCSASGIICIHNHPSGDIKPSREDIRLTNALVEIGNMNGIPIIDHMIIGNDNYYSFYEDGKIVNL